MHFNWKIILALYLLFPLSILAQPSQKDQQSTIQGVWVTNDTGFQMTVSFNQDGTGKLDKDQIRYKIQGDKLDVTLYGEITTYNYKLAGNTLTISGGDLDEPLKFVRIENQSSKKRT